MSTSIGSVVPLDLGLTFNLVGLYLSIFSTGYYFVLELPPPLASRRFRAPSSWVGNASVAWRAGSCLRRGPSVTRLIASQSANPKSCHHGAVNFLRPFGNDLVLAIYDQYTLTHSDLQ